MKIMHVITGLNVGGAERALQKLLFSATKDDMCNIVISLTDLGVIGKQLRDAGFQVYILEMSNPLSFFSTILKLRKIISHYNPDIVQTWLYHADLIGGIAAKSCGVKCILWGIRTTELKKGSFVTGAIRRCLSLLSYFIPTKIICVAHASKRKHISLGYCKKKMLVIQNGFNLNDFQSTEKQRQISREKHGVKQDDIIIGTVGRFNQVKGQDLFVGAANIVASENSRVKFMMIGRDNDLENIILKDWINKSHYSDRFILLGEQEDMPACFSAMDIFCLHSRSEGFPNVLGEAMSMGLPCVTTNVGDAAVLLEDTGFVAQELTIKSIAAALQKMIDQPQEKRVSFGGKAHARIKNNFDIELTYKHYKTLYSNLLHKKIL